MMSICLDGPIFFFKILWIEPKSLASVCHLATTGYLMVDGVPWDAADSAGVAGQNSYRILPFNVKYVDLK